MLDNNKCKDCPARRLRIDEQIKKINHWHGIFLSEVEKVNPIKIILLGESFPKDKYIYDLKTNYDTSGLRYNLRVEFGQQSDNDLMLLFRELGIIVYDCAFCPLHRLNDDVEKILAATQCLMSYKIDLLNNTDCPIITFFPKGRGYIETEVPSVTSRIVARFQFSKLQGLKTTVQKCLRNESKTSF
jgi:hypothetical protein